MDGHVIRHAKLVPHKLIEFGDRVELVFLPPYSPQLNLDEGAWARVKQEAGKQIVLAELATMPKAVIAIFGQLDFRYAAERFFKRVPQYAPIDNFSKHC